MSLRELLFTARATTARAAALRALVLFGGAVALAGLLSRVSYEGQPAGDPAGALVRAAAAQGLAADARSLHWIVPPRRGGMLGQGVGQCEAVFLARTGPAAPRDFYYARARVAPDGRVASLRTWNYSATGFLSEDAVWASGRTVVYASRDERGFLGVTLLDFRGQGRQATAGWPAVERLKDGVTNVQKLGRVEGVNLSTMELREPQASVAVSMKGRIVFVSLDGGSAVVKLGDGGFRLEEGPGGDVLDFATTPKAMSGHVAWIVDTARATELVGKEKVGWAESRFYRLADILRRAFWAAAGSDFTMRELAEEVRGDGDEAGGSIEEFLAAHPGGAGFEAGAPGPVAPLAGMEAMPGEGVWKPMADEAFTLLEEGKPPALLRTFVRPDPARPFALANLVAWDPRMVELHVAAGAAEPKSETGRAGTGTIPRDEETLLRLLGGFNGGFQALHGEFGLMQEGKVYLPPKPWAATVALLKGGRIGFGTWPGPDTGEIPGEIVSYRQNLTPLVQDSVFNPYKRHWWGSSPDLNPDSPMIARSGICWTKTGHVVYGLAYSVNEETYADAMRRAGCHYLIQLDVNSGHSGFELVRVTRAGQEPPLAGPLEKEWEAQGPVEGAGGFWFRAKKLFKKMSIMRFPRYIGRDPRDFFYITLARTLPGPPLPAGEGAEAEPWKAGGTGAGAFPPAFVTTTVREGERGSVKVVMADPRWLAVAAEEGPGAGPEVEEARLVLPAGTRVALRGGAEWDVQPGEEAIVLGYDALADEWRVLAGAWDEAIAQPFSTVLAMRAPGEPPQGAPVAGALGIGPGRFFAWAEDSEGDAGRLRRVLELAGCVRVFLFPREEGVAAGWFWTKETNGKTKLLALLDKPASAFAAAEGGGALHFGRSARAGVVRLFPDTAVVQPKVWNPGQTKRIRYFKQVPPDGGNML